MAERQVIGRMQQRHGPNRLGPFGLLQSLADGVKLALKEDIIPAPPTSSSTSSRRSSPAIPAFLAFAVIPFGPTVSIFGHQTPLQLTDLPGRRALRPGLRLVGVYGIVLAGWSSGSTYPLLGGLRSSAQIICYEIAMGLSLVGGLPLRRLDVDVGDRRGAGKPSGTSCRLFARRSSST